MCNSLINTKWTCIPLICQPTQDFSIYFEWMFDKLQKCMWVKINRKSNMTLVLFNINENDHCLYLKCWHMVLKQISALQRYYNVIFRSHRCSRSCLKYSYFPPQLRVICTVFFEVNVEGWLNDWLAWRVAEWLNSWKWPYQNW